MSAPIDSAELKKLAEEAKGALALLQQDYSKIGGLAEDTKKNLEDHLHKFQDIVSEVQTVKAAAEKSIKDHEDQVTELKKELENTRKGTIEHEVRVKHLELMLASGPTGIKSTDEKKLRENDVNWKNFIQYYKKGELGDNARDLYQFAPHLAEFKTLRTDADVNGGYLLPEIMDNEIRKNIVEQSPVRLYARGRVAPGKSMSIPRRGNLLLAYYEGEAEQGEQSESQYISETVTLFRQTITVPATLDLMLVSPFDIEREIANDVAESMAAGEGRNFLKGSGHKGPQGILSDTRIEVIESADSGTFDFDDLSNMVGKLKRGQNPMFFMNRRTLSYIWSIKSSIGVPIWQPVAGDTPATIWGYRYDSNMIDLDDAQTGSAAKPLLFGDMRRCYEVFDLMGMSVIRDDLTQKRKAVTEWTFNRYNTGQVIIPEAMKVLKIK